MGLDITVSRLGKRADLKSGKIYSFSMYKIDDTNNVVFDDGGFPKWTLNLVEYSDVEFYDFEKYRIMTGIDVNDYTLCAEGPVDLNKNDLSFDDDEAPCGMVIKHKETGARLAIAFDTLPTMVRNVPLIYYVDVEGGYQRKGLNAQFYKDYDAGICKYFVWDREELERIYDEYVDEAARDYYKEHILGKFVEGECVVTFDW